MSSARQEARLPRLRSNSKLHMESAEIPSRNTALMDEEARSMNVSSRPWSAQASASAYPQLPSRKPLVDYCTNDWQHSSKWKSQQQASSDEFEGALESFLGRCLAVLKAPKVRRYLLFYTIVFILTLWLWSSALWPAWAEHRTLTRSLSGQNRRMAGGTFGMNLRPAFQNMIQVADLDSRHLPKASAPKHPTLENINRLVFIGDVHGCLSELKELLERVQFNPRNDHLVTTGDLIAKGPDSLATVEFVRKLGASCVRGNHEDRVLLTAHSLSSKPLHLETPSRNGIDNLDEQSYSLSDSPDRALTESLSPEQIEYLESCPVILRVGFLKHLAGDLVVVHAGLVPGVPLERQDPTAVMSMRSIDLDTHVPSKDSDALGGVHWIKLWNKYQQSLPSQWSLFPSNDPDAQKAKESHTTVIYGHDARKGLQLKQYSKGIDTGCVRGGKLTALVMSDGGAMQTIQVQCKDYRKRRPTKVEVNDVLRDGRVESTEDGANE